MKIANYLRIIILISFIVALMCACKNHETKIVEESDYLEVEPLVYKGHEYLWFRPKIRSEFGEITHDPECEKCKK